MKILFLGTADFPHGMAEVEKQTLIARSLSEQGCDVLFLCKKSFNFNTVLPSRGKYKGIEYFYTSLSSKRLKNKYLNSLSWVFGSILEKIFLLVADYNYVIVNSRSYSEISLYSKIIHLRRKKIFLTYTEDLRSMHPFAGSEKLAQIAKFELNTWKIIDGAFPISEELIRQIRNHFPLLPLLKIPVLVDLNDAVVINENEIISNDYFMFCGSADYFETIEHIINSFEIAGTDKSLLLVINGPQSSIKRVIERTRISNSNDKILIKSNLTKESLWGYYKNAFSLLIPLNFNQRDKARFPHKIGEYCASRSAIITSNWGEVPYYFHNKENCLLLNTENKEEFGELMKYICDNHKLRRKISDAAYKTASTEFDYKIYGVKILDFIKKVDNRLL
jgi:glycosyltransferase involved in cell wall biosynthesis